MRIKIIGDNNCARATRHLLRLAGFAVTEFLPVDAVTHAPHFGYAITINLAPADHTPDFHPKPEPATHAHAARHGEALSPPISTSSVSSFSADDGASSRHFSEDDANNGAEVHSCGAVDVDGEILPGLNQGKQAEAYSTCGGAPSASHIHFDSVDSLLELAVLRHVTQLAADAVILDRPGGVVHSERELRIAIPCTGDARADEAAAVAVELGVLRGLLDLTSAHATPTLFAAAGSGAASGPWNAARNENSRGVDNETSGMHDTAAGESRLRAKKWWMFGLALLTIVTMISGARRMFGLRVLAAPSIAAGAGASRVTVGKHFGKGTQDESCATGGDARCVVARETRPGSAAKFVPAKVVVLSAYSAPAQGQVFSGQFVDPCKTQTKLYASISQTANAQIVAGTASRKIYVCSIHVVVAAATNVALVEGTGTVCATSTAGVGGFGGATAATGWNFAANGGIAFGNGDSAVGAEGTSADNLCVFNSGSGQVSGGISYVVQ